MYFTTGVLFLNTFNKPFIYLTPNDSPRSPLPEMKKSKQRFRVFPLLNRVLQSSI